MNRGERYLDKILVVFVIYIIKDVHLLNLIIANTKIRYIFNIYLYNICTFRMFGVIAQFEDNFLNSEYDT